MIKLNLRKGILQYLYNKGGRFIARDKDGELILTEEKPYRDADYFCCLKGDMCEINGIEKIFSDVKWENEPLDIEKEISTIDWLSVKVDTPVLVRHNEMDEWKRQHFHSFVKESKRPYVCYWQGMTSFTCENVEPQSRTNAWEYCKLFDEKDN